MSRTTQCRTNLDVLDFLLWNGTCCNQDRGTAFNRVWTDSQIPHSKSIGECRSHSARNPSHKIVQLAFNVSIQQSTVQRCRAFFQKNCWRRQIQRSFMGAACIPIIQTVRTPNTAEIKQRYLYAATVYRSPSMHRPRPDDPILVHFYISKGPNHLNSIEFRILEFLGIPKNYRIQFNLQILGFRLARITYPPFLASQPNWNDRHSYSYSC